MRSVKEMDDIVKGLPQSTRVSKIRMNVQTLSRGWTKRLKKIRETKQRQAGKKDSEDGI
jgi:hypothetical protein